MNLLLILNDKNQLLYLNQNTITHQSATSPQNIHWLFHSLNLSSFERKTFHIFTHFVMFNIKPTDWNNSSYHLKMQMLPFFPHLTCKNVKDVKCLHFFLLKYVKVQKFSHILIFLPISSHWRFSMHPNNNNCFSDVFRGYRKILVAWNVLIALWI